MPYHYIKRSGWIGNGERPTTYKGEGCPGTCPGFKKGAKCFPAKFEGKKGESGMSEQEVLLPIGLDNRPLFSRDEEVSSPFPLERETAEEEQKKPTINEADWDARGLLMPPEVREEMHRQKRQVKSKTKQEPERSGPDGGVLLPIEFRRR